MADVTTACTDTGTTYFYTTITTSGTTITNITHADPFNVVPSAANPKRYLVELPNWHEGLIREFIDIINWKTNTGIKIDLIAHGRVDICDSTIKKIALRDFMTSVMWNRGSQCDREVINKFVYANLE